MIFDLGVSPQPCLPLLPANVALLLPSHLPSWLAPHTSELLLCWQRCQEGANPNPDCGAQLRLIPYGERHISMGLVSDVWDSPAFLPKALNFPFLLHLKANKLLEKQDAAGEESRGWQQALGCVGAKWGTGGRWDGTGHPPQCFSHALMESELPGVLQKSSSVGVPGHHAGSTPTLPCTPSPAVQQ